jgi:hypothetical protein
MWCCRSVVHKKSTLFFTIIPKSTSVEGLLMTA